MSQRPFRIAREVHDSTASPLSRRALLATTALGVPLAVTAVTSAPALADPAVSGGETRIVDVPLADVEQVDAEGIQVRDLPDQPATMVGATWPDDSVEPTVLARGLGEDGTWTEWFELETAMNPDTGESAAATEVAWVGVVSALQIRAEAEGSDVTDLVTAHVVTTSEADDDARVEELSGRGSSVEEDQAAPGAGPQARTMSTMAAAGNPATPKLSSNVPPFVSRASWGADESRTGTTYGREALKAVVIHHTAGTNNYSSSQSASIVRGILSYHTRTLGWTDIGYNVLVDKYGRIFEGRSGGLHRNIQGAHASGFNRGTFGISVMGDHSTTSVSTAARDAVSRLVGWKFLSTFQQSVSARTTWSSIGTGTRFPEGSSQSLPVVMGHRDVNETACPGDRLYGQFDRIRSDAQRHVDTGWKHHLNAFTAAGGAATLGTVTHSTYSTGSFWATRLTKGLVLHQGGGAAKGYASDFAQQWQQSWGRPVRNPSQDGDRRIQPFQHGTAALEDGNVRFVSPAFRDVDPSRVFYLEIQDLYAAGVTAGWGSGSSRTFQPNSDNLRDAMIVFIYRAMGSPSYTAPATSPFRDVDPSFVFYRELCWAFDEGITKGWGSGANRTFRPLEPVKRDAVAAFLYRAAGSPSASPADADRFSDVSRSHIFAKEIGWLATTGISRGWDDGTFRPDAFIKRDQMATFVMRWMRQTGRA